MGEVLLGNPSPRGGGRGSITLLVDIPDEAELAMAVILSAWAQHAMGGPGEIVPASWVAATAPAVAGIASRVFGCPIVDLVEAEAQYEILEGLAEGGDDEDVKAAGRWFREYRRGVAEGPP